MICETLLIRIMARKEFSLHPSTLFNKIFHYVNHPCSLQYLYGVFLPNETNQDLSTEIDDQKCFTCDSIHLTLSIAIYLATLLTFDQSALAKSILAEKENNHNSIWFLFTIDSLLQLSGSFSTGNSSLYDIHADKQLFVLWQSLLQTLTTCFLDFQSNLLLSSDKPDSIVVMMQKYLHCLGKSPCHLCLVTYSRLVQHSLKRSLVKEKKLKDSKIIQTLGKNEKTILFPVICQYIEPDARLHLLQSLTQDFRWDREQKLAIFSLISTSALSSEMIANIIEQFGVSLETQSCLFEDVFLDGLFLKCLLEKWPSQNVFDLIHPWLVSCIPWQSDKEQISCSRNEQQLLDCLIFDCCEKATFISLMTTNYIYPYALRRLGK